jgi:DnaJ-class molecular chaperone
MIEIFICSRCKGAGFNHNDYRHKCLVCDGTGRTTKRTFSYEVPYNIDLNKLSEAQIKIFNIINELEDNIRKNISLL